MAKDNKRFDKRGSAEATDSKKDRKYGKRSKDTTKEDKRGKITDSSNDPTWYARNEQLLKDAANLPFNIMRGLDHTFMMDGTAKARVGTSRMGIGNIMAHVLFPTAGAPVDWNSPTNVAARNLYTWVRHMNSGHTNYDAPNYMMYVLSMASVYSFIEWCKRLYGIVGTASVYNRGIPRGLIRANGVDYSSLSNNIATFRTWLNLFIKRAATMAVPAQLPYFARAQFLYSSVYADATNPLAQYSMYVPFGFYKYNEPGTGANVGTLTVEPIASFGSLLGTDETAASITTDVWKGALASRIDQETGSTMSVQAIMNYGDDMLNRILWSEDFNIMSGDTLKAFGTEGLMKLYLITEDYGVVPTYNPEVLHQMHNMEHAMGVASSALTSFSINPNFGKISENVSTGPNNGALVMEGLMHKHPTSTVIGHHSAVDYAESILDFDLDSPTYGDVMVSTRLKCGFTQAVDGSNASEYLTLAGTEIAMYSQMWYGSGAGCVVFANSQTSEFVSARLAAFKLAPTCFRFSTLGAGNPMASSTIMTEVANFTFVAKSVLKRMNTVALLSLFDTPTIGFWKVGQN